MWFDVKRSCFGEKMLWLAVLRRAIFDYALYDGVGVHSFDWKQANQFIFGNPIQDGLTFEETCTLFEWEPEYVRRLIRSLTKDDVRKLESRRFKEEFIFDATAELVHSSPKWDFVNMGVPFFPPSNYIDKYRRLVTLHTVHPEKINTYTPIVRWDTVTA